VDHYFEFIASEARDAIIAYDSVLGLQRPNPPPNAEGPTAIADCADEKILIGACETYKTADGLKIRIGAHLRGADSHYKDRAWLKALEEWVVVWEGLKIVGWLRGYQLVKYFGSCIGSESLTYGTTGVDRSNKYYYIDLGCVSPLRAKTSGLPIKANFKFLMSEFTKAIEERGDTRYNEKFQLLILKFCKPQTMFNYILIYTIRTFLPIEINERISTFIGDLTIHYDKGLDRFCKLADHHSTSMMASTLTDDYNLKLVFERGTFIRSEGLQSIGQSDRLLRNVASLVHAASDSPRYGQNRLELLCVTEGEKPVCMFWICHSALPCHLIELITDYVGPMILCVFLEDLSTLVIAWDSNGIARMESGIPAAWDLGLIYS